jgi:ribosomal protein S18 acetylase RimI-like enzyme
LRNGFDGRRAGGSAVAGDEAAKSAARSAEAAGSIDDGLTEVRIRRVHRRDLSRIWEFLKLVFRNVNRETVEFQRPRSKQRFLEVYAEDGVDQLVFTVRDNGREAIVAYAECTRDLVGADSWINLRYFKKREMRPFFVEELAVHPGYQGRGLGTFVLEQLEHLARLNGCSHLVLEVAENNKAALAFYRARSFTKLDAAIFMAKPVHTDSDLLPPRRLPVRKA